MVTSFVDQLSLATSPSELLAVIVGVVGRINTLYGLQTVPVVGTLLIALAKTYFFPQVLYFIELVYVFQVPVQLDSDVESQYSYF